MGALASGHLWCGFSCFFPHARTPCYWKVRHLKPLNSQTFHTGLRSLILYWCLPDKWSARVFWPQLSIWGQCLWESGPRLGCPRDAGMSLPTLSWKVCKEFLADGSLCWGAHRQISAVVANHSNRSMSFKSANQVGSHFSIFLYIHWRQEGHTGNASKKLCQRLWTFASSHGDQVEAMALRAMATRTGDCECRQQQEDV